jgi:hypothetical protein
MLSSNPRVYLADARATSLSNYLHQTFSWQYCVSSRTQTRMAAAGDNWEVLSLAEMHFLISEAEQMACT